MTTPPLPPNHELQPREFPEKYGAQEGMKESQAEINTERVWFNSPYPAGRPINKNDLDYYIFCAPIGTIASVTTPLPEARCDCADWGMMDHLTSCPAHSRNALVRILPGRLAGLGKKPGGLMWANIGEADWEKDEDDITHYPWSEADWRTLGDGSFAFAVPRWSMDEIEAEEREAIDENDKTFICSRHGARYEGYCTVCERDSLARAETASNQPDAQASPAEVAVSSAGRITPEREAWLRAKPAHYHVHELWPELEALRAELAKKTTASAGRPTDGEMLDWLFAEIELPIAALSIICKLQNIGAARIAGMPLRAAIANAMKGEGK